MHTEDQIKTAYLRLRASGVTPNGSRLRLELGGGNVRRYGNLIANWMAEESASDEAAPPVDDEARLNHQVFTVIHREILAGLRQGMPYLAKEIVEPQAAKLASAVHDKLIDASVVPNFRDPEEQSGGYREKYKDSGIFGDF
jgi:hypothetical protein